MSGDKRNSAIFYEQDGFKTDGKRLLGRQSAGESFLKGFTRYSGVDNLYCYTDHAAKFKHFETQVQSFSDNGPPAKWIRPSTVGQMRDPGCFFYSGPAIGDFAWQRRHVGSNSYSLCGLTHTISSSEVMQAFGDLAIAPLEEWDALICTSKSVRDAVDHVLANWVEYLEERNGGKVKLPVQLPIIPLGINCEDFDPGTRGDAYRQSFRAEHGIGEDDVVVLYMGRLSSHAKAHPLPMYQALEKAAARTKRKLHLVQAGWFASDVIEKQFVDGARKFCPSINSIFLDGRDLEIRQNIWFAADIFTSLSDNIQETFGITPVEAMAAGLPVVATDWDGYRETVRDGVDGILARTTFPAPGCGPDLAYRYQIGMDSYDRFVGQVSLFTNVDTEACAEAYLKLIDDPELRAKMGRAGYKRARNMFDWKVLVPVYQDLWADLGDRRMNQNIEKTVVPVPLLEDPFSLFQHYPTQRMTPKTRLRGKADRKKGVSYFLNDPLGSGAKILLPSAEELEKYVAFIECNDQCSIGDVAAEFDVRLDRFVRHIGWLAKMDLIDIVPNA